MPQIDLVTTPNGVFASSFAAAAFSGLAALLRSGTTITKVGVISAMLNSGLLGLGISLIWYVYLEGNLYLLVGLCVLAGLGGMTTIDFAMRAFRKFALTVRLGPDMAEKLTKNEEKNNE